MARCGLPRVTAVGSSLWLDILPVRALRSWTTPADLGPSTTIQLLDEPVTPEDYHFGDIH